jgi:conjugative transposon TraN protein
MKPLLLFLLLILMLCPAGITASAQAGATAGMQPFESKPYLLTITSQKTTSLIFPARILSVDRGTRDVLVQKIKGVDNVLQLKAGRTGFTETNLTVITADGRLHSFLVTYSANPAHLTFDFREVQASTGQVSAGKSDAPPVQLSGVLLSEESLRAYARELVTARPCVRNIRYRHHKIRFSVKGLYIGEDVLFYQLAMQNRSHIPYDVGFIRCYIRDKEQARRTATQEIDVTPLLLYGNTERVEGRQISNWVLALEKFTIPDAKKLVIELQERGGGRHARLQIRNRHLINARPLPKQLFTANHHRP